MDHLPLDAARRDDAVARLCADLARNALFRVSAADPERFHVDFLHWLVSAVPLESAHVWHTLVGECFDELPERPIRGRDRVDLGFSLAGGRRVVVQSSLRPAPATEPLLALSEQLGRQADPTPICVLLSLFPPAGPVPEPWRHVAYADLLHPLGVTVVALRTHDRSDDAVVVDLYIRALRGLERLRELTDPAAHPDLPLKLGPEAERALRETHLLSLVREAQGCGLAAMVRDRLASSSSAPDLGEPGVDPVASDMSGATATIGHVLRVREGEDRGRGLGWQLQNHRFRLVAAGFGDGTGAAADERAEEWFDFSPYASGGLALPDAPARTWHRAGDDVAYRYRQLPADATPEQLVALAAEASTRAREHVARLEGG